MLCTRFACSFVKSIAHLAELSLNSLIVGLKILLVEVESSIISEPDNVSNGLDIISKFFFKMESSVDKRATAEGRFIGVHPIIMCDGSSLVAGAYLVLEIWTQPCAKSTVPILDQRFRSVLVRWRSLLLLRQSILPGPKHLGYILVVVKRVDNKMPHCC